MKINREKINTIYTSFEKKKENKHRSLDVEHGKGFEVGTGREEGREGIHERT